MPRAAGRHFLQIPGPTNVPDRVLRAIDSPTIDHRGPEFGQLGRAVLAEMKRVFKSAKGEVVIYPASGTGAWEAALVNTLSPGDRMLMYETGHFATLWHKMALRLGLQPDFIAGDWRTGAEPPKIESSAWRKTRKRASRPYAWCTTRPRPESHRASPKCGARSTPPGTRRSSWWTRFRRSPRSTTGTTNGGWT